MRLIVNHSTYFVSRRQCLCRVNIKNVNRVFDRDLLKFDRRKWSPSKLVDGYNGAVGEVRVRMICLQVSRITESYDESDDNQLYYTVELLLSAVRNIINIIMYASVILSD